jgi:hypothetical protein
MKTNLPCTTTTIQYKLFFILQIENHGLFTTKAPLEIAIIAMRIAAAAAEIGKCCQCRFESINQSHNTRGQDK